MLFDAGASTRIAFTVLARLEWDGHDLCTRTTNLSLRDLSCRLPSGGGQPVPTDRSTPVLVTLPLDGDWTTLTARVAGHRTDAGGRVVDLRLVGLQASQRALLQQAIRGAGQRS